MSIKRLFSTLIVLCLFSQLGLAQLGTRSFSGFSDRPVPLPLEQAFPFYVSVESPGHFKIHWSPAAGHYLYRHAFDFSMQQSSDTKVLPVDFVLPAGLKKTDQFFGDIEAYYDEVTVDISLPTLPVHNAMLLIQYQGCADWGFCYPPQRFEFNLSP